MHYSSFYEKDDPPSPQTTSVGKILLAQSQVPTRETLLDLNRRLQLAIEKENLADVSRYAEMISKLTKGFLK